MLMRRGKEEYQKRGGRNRIESDMRWDGVIEENTGDRVLLKLRTSVADLKYLGQGTKEKKKKKIITYIVYPIHYTNLSQIL